MNVDTILKEAKTIAIVGLSDTISRPSYQVGLYFHGQGYRIIPINPKLTQWESIPSYASLKDVPKDIRIDIVDVFRKSEDVPQVMDDVLALGYKPQMVWLQQGVVSEEAKQKADEAGIPFVQNRCLRIAHVQMMI